MTEPKNLFKPIKVGNYDVQNRVAMAPLTRLRATDEHVPTPLMAEYYEQRSRTPGTLLITEATYISEAASGYPNAPGIWSDEQVKGWKPVFDGIHANGSFGFVQLWAIGRQADPEVLKKAGHDYVGPSSVFLKVTYNPDYTSFERTESPRELTIPEIKQYVQWYAQAAKNAVAAGADGVEIHGANGYLIDEFLHPNSNTRTDEYGGSVVNRARFALEVIDAVVDAIGAEKVGIRLSPWGTYGEMFNELSPIPQYSYLVAEIERRATQGKRLAYISTMETRGDTDTPNLPANPPEDLYSLNDFIGLIWTGPWVRSSDLLNNRQIVDQDDRTILAIGRHFISNPDLIERLKKGTDLAEYDRSTFYWGYRRDFDQAKGYVDYGFAA